MRPDLACLVVSLAAFGSAVSWPVWAAPEPPLASKAFELAALGADNSLILFRSDTPQKNRVLKITGTNELVIGIDLRPADKKLYGITQGNSLVVIDTNTAVAQRVSKLSSAFRGGNASGFDFNPQSDRLRLVAATRQNLRVNVDVGAVGIDGVLIYASDDLHSGSRPTITATAYTNSVASARTTVMLVIDHMLDTLVRQDPPNDGILSTIGPLGIDCGASIGFDIATDARGADYPFLVCGQQLYALDIKTGTARPIGRIDAAVTDFFGLAVVGE